MKYLYVFVRLQYLLMNQAKHVTMIVKYSQTHFKSICQWTIWECWKKTVSSPIISLAKVWLFFGNNDSFCSQLTESFQHITEVLCIISWKYTFWVLSFLHCTLTYSLNFLPSSGIESWRLLERLGDAWIAKRALTSFFIIQQRQL